MSGPEDGMRPLPADSAGDADALATALAIIEAASGDDLAALDNARVRQSRSPFRAVVRAVATHFQLSVTLADRLASMAPADGDRVRAAMAATVLGLLDSVDTAEAGRTVTTLAVGTNTLRDHTDEFRRVADDLIGGYLTTGQYHESHEGFVTLSLLLEQYLYAMADATTAEHDILDDAVSSNIRTVTNLVRGVSYYGRRIADMPASSYRNVGRVLREEADLRHVGELLTAIMVIQNRLAELSPGADRNLIERFWSGVDPEVADRFARNLITQAGNALDAHPDVIVVIARSAARLAWRATRAVVRSVVARRGRRVPTASVDVAGRP